MPILSSDKKSKSAKATNYSLSAIAAAVLAGLISAYQTFLAILDMLQLGIDILGVIVSSIIATCSAFINYHMGVDLFKNFVNRLYSGPRMKSDKQLSRSEQLQYWGGLVLFVVNGILFGCAGFILALTLGANPIIVVLAVVTGVLSALLNMIQEIETWLEKFDIPTGNALAPHNKEKITGLKKYLGKIIGSILSFLIAASISAFLTAGLIGALAACGYASFPIIGASVLAIVIGGGSSFFYYHEHLTAFFCQIQHYYLKFIEAGALKKISVFINAFAAGAANYTGLLLLAAIIAIPNPLIIIAGIVGFLGSLLLGIYFLPTPDKKNISEPKPTAQLTNNINNPDPPLKQVTALRPLLQKTSIKSAMVPAECHQSADLSEKHYVKSRLFSSAALMGNHSNSLPILKERGQMLAPNKLA